MQAITWAKSPVKVLTLLRGQSPAFLVAGIIMVIYIVAALAGPVLAPYPPTKMLAGDPYEHPSAQHLLGTDNLGRDVFSRVVYGERVVLSLALSATGLAVILGTLLGLILGYVRGWVDEVVMRVMDILISIPPLILSLLILGALGASYVLIILTVAFFYVPRVATVIRAATLDVVTEDFITIARLRGESAWSIAIRELLPNVVGTVFVEFSLRTGYAVIFIGGLGFLGFGAAPPTPEWGLMINEGRAYLSMAPWAVLGPSIAIAVLVIALSLFTEGSSQLLGLSAQQGHNK